MKRICRRIEARWPAGAALVLLGVTTGCESQVLSGNGGGDTCETDAAYTPGPIWISRFAP